jgi:hypothetical protein
MVRHRKLVLAFLGLGIILAMPLGSPVPTTRYTHDDCVAYGAATAPPHDPNPHGEHVTGFVGGDFPPRFALQHLGFFGDGICPTTMAGPILAQDFVGTYRVVALCAEGSGNAGGLLLDWTMQFVTLQPVGNQRIDGDCAAPAAGTYALDVWVEIQPLRFPTDSTVFGGIRLTITQ